LLIIPKEKDFVNGFFQIFLEEVFLF